MDMDRQSHTGTGRMAGVLAVVVAAAVGLAEAHSRFSCPAARNPSTGIKAGPCGNEEGQLTVPAPVEVVPGPLTILLEESITHRGAPWRIALSREGEDVYDECVLVDHVPHNDRSQPTNADMTPYYLTINIPDVDCQNCSLQMANMMTDKINDLSCTYPGSCFSVYHSCANVRILGSVPRDDFVCTPDPTWPYNALTPGEYTRVEEALWEDGWLVEAGVPASFRTPAGSCSDGAPAAPEPEFFSCAILHSRRSIELRWKVVGDVLRVSVQAETTGWVGVAVTARRGAGMMAGSDFVIGYVDSTSDTPHIDDRFLAESEDNGLPPKDSDTAGCSDDLANASVTVEGGVTTLFFERPLAASDACDNAIDQLGEVTFLFAMSDENPGPYSPGFHSINDFVTLDLTEQTVCLSKEADELGEDGNDDDDDDGGGGSDDDDDAQPVGFCNESPRVCVEWVVRGAAVEFFVEAETNGYVAVGVSNSGAMPQADVMVLWMDDDAGELVVGDRRVPTSRSMPQFDASQDVSLLPGGSHVDGTLRARFTRLANTLDATGDIEIDLTGKKQFVLWSVGDAPSGGASADFEYHRSRGVQRVNFVSGESEAVSSGVLALRRNHGVVMFLTWGVVTPVAILIARYFKHIGHLWYQLHMGLQMATLVLHLTGFALAVRAAEGTTHFGGLHQVVGLMATLALFAQIALGFLANRMFSPGRDKVPVWPDRVHWWLGRVLLGGTAFNIFLGLALYKADAWAFYLFALWLVALAALVLVLEQRQCKRATQSTMHENLLEYRD